MKVPLQIRADGVLLWNGVAVEINNAMFDGKPVIRAVARLDPEFGAAWEINYATGRLAHKIVTASNVAITQRLEEMFDLHPPETA